MVSAPTNCKVMGGPHMVIALTRILETVVTFHFSGGKVYSMNKGCHTCMIKHNMHVQSLHCSTYEAILMSTHNIPFSV